MLAGLVFAGFHAVPPLGVAIVLSVALNGMNAAGQLQKATAGDSPLGGLLALVFRFTDVGVGVAMLVVWLAVAAYVAACAILYPLAVGLCARLLQSA